MVTYWPVKNKNAPGVRELSRNSLVNEYDQLTAIMAITDADKNEEELARRRGPFLIAWSPARSRFEKDAVVLVIDLSGIDGQDSFVDIFKVWRQRIIDDPKLWKRGWDPQLIVLVLRDTLARYGENLVRLIKLN